MASTLPTSDSAAVPTSPLLVAQLHNNVNAKSGGYIFSHIYLDNGIYFTGIVDDPYLLDRGVDLLDQLQLLLYGIHIRSTRYVGAGLLQALDHTGLYRVGHSGNKNRYLVGSRSRRLGAGGGMARIRSTLSATNPSQMVTDVAISPWAFLKSKTTLSPSTKPSSFQPFNETLPGRVEGGMFHDLDNADFIRFRSLRPLLN